ncbi:glycosyltransferase [Collinsella intestinalis]|uniref:glycosyltransferase n=1 Tax=Collinsella intestinalis TaxID=147207 RepID=UPI001958E73F|nr:glycosyltransferase [Collinsella intestinalis]
MIDKRVRPLKLANQIEDTMIRLYSCHIEQQGKIPGLGKRQQALITAALNYHTLVHSDQPTLFHVYEGQPWDFPQLNGEKTSRSTNLSPDSSLLLSLVAKSSPNGIWVDFANESNVGSDVLTLRHLLVPPESATPADVEAHAAKSLPRALYALLESSCPLQFDELRERQRIKREHAWFDSIKKFNPLQELPYLHDTDESLNRLAAPSHINTAKQKAIIFGMYWLQAGGAERWALETIAIAKRYGLLPIVITDRDSLHPWITKDALADTLILPLAHPQEEVSCDEPLLRALFERFEICGVLIHHCQWLYDRTYWIKHFYPKCPIVDTTHILEYKYSGAFPHEAVSHDETIDLHHVISPQLSSWLVSIHGINPAKVIYAPLTGLTATTKEPEFKKPSSSNALTVAFVGRLARQKRPEAFILLARYLARRADCYRFILHGSGNLEMIVDKLIERNNLQAVIERRAESDPVSITYNDADVLVISSVNEGLTLTTMEAVCAGIPVISCDVGSQNTLIPPEGLTRRKSRDFITDAAYMIESMRENEDRRMHLWEEERERLKHFEQAESASSFFDRLLSRWSNQHD